MVGGFIATLIIALFLTAIASVFFRRKGPWGTVWTFFLILFLALWTVSIYVRSVGPVYWGIAWLPLLFAAIILAVALAIIVPDANQMRDDSFSDSETNNTTSGEKIRDLSRPRRGNWFWLIIVILIAAILVGMVNPQMAL